MIHFLENTLKKLDLPNRELPRKEGTALITNAIETACFNDCISWHTEVRIGLTRKIKTERQGIVDFVIVHNDIRYGIEIDSANKKWSLEKLKYLAEHGYVAIWIRWNRPVTMDIPENIHLLDFTKSDS